MQNFIFHNTVKIIFGHNEMHQLPAEIKAHGKKILWVYGGGSIKKNGIYQEIEKHLKDNAIAYVELAGVQPNPRLSSVHKGIQLCKDNGIDFILAVGGGSVLDCAKGIAAGVYYNGDVWDLYEGKATVGKVLPVGTVLTLAATGSEMNGNSVVKHDTLPQKSAIRDAKLCPVFSFLNPTYTKTLDWRQTACGAMDIWSHLVEQYFTKTAFEPTDAMTEAMFRTVLDNAPIALADPNNMPARENLLWAGTIALNGLLACGKGRGDWSSHMIEALISGRYDNAHGEGLAVIIPAWMEASLNGETAPQFARYGEKVFGITEGNTMEKAKGSLVATRRFIKDVLKLPTTLSALGAKSEHMATIANTLPAFQQGWGEYYPMTTKSVEALLNKAL